MKKIITMIIVSVTLISGLTLTSQTVLAAGVHSKVTGQLIAPTPSSKDNDSVNPSNLPDTGEKRSSLFIEGVIALVLASGMVYYSRKKWRINMIRIKHLSGIVAILVSLVWISITAHANTPETTVTGEITAGDFSMTLPNSISFNAKLTGKTQEIDLDEINTTVTDYRGSQDGWQITVNSPNYTDYANNYQLVINGKTVGNNESVAFKVDKQILVKDLNLPVKMEISAKALAGSYSADLVWNLQPNIKNEIKE